MSLFSTLSPKHGFFDAMAMGFSGLCLIHCIVLPGFLMALPALSVDRFWPEELHFIAAVLAALACAAAIMPRWRALNKRKRRRIGLCALCGLGCLFAAMTLNDHMAETTATVFGSLLLIAAHIQNLRA